MNERRSQKEGKVVLEHHILELEGSLTDQIGVIGKVIGKVQGVKVLVRGKIRLYIKII